MDEPVKIRQTVPGDLPYIYATGLRTWRSLDNSCLPDDLFYPAYRSVLDRLLGSAETEALVACSSDMPNEILGYIVAKKDELWLVYVRKSLRQMGLCRQLMAAAKVDQKTPSAWGARDVGLKNPLKSRSLRQSVMLTE